MSPEEDTAVFLLIRYTVFSKKLMFSVENYCQSLAVSYRQMSIGKHRFLIAAVISILS